MAVFEVPLTPVAQTLTILLAGTTYGLRLIYVDAPDEAAGWVMDIADIDGVSLLTGVPLVTGADLLAQYAYLNIPGRWYVVSDGNPVEVPSYSDLGVTSHLCIDL